MSMGRRQQIAASLAPLCPAGAGAPPGVEHGKFWDPQQRTFVGQDPVQESQQIAQEVFARKNSSIHRLQEVIDGAIGNLPSMRNPLLNGLAKMNPN
jgi:hypothetical protein